MTRQLWRFSGGLPLPGHRQLSNRKPALPPLIPERLVLPLRQHIGTSPRPVVASGDKVLKGQVIARPTSYVSTPLHAPTSGTVTAIGAFPVAHPSGLNGECLVIQPDGEDRWIDRIPLRNYEQAEPALLHRRLEAAGVIGMGGAGFPSHVKINEAMTAKVHTVIINGVECEPYITCDDRLIQDRAQEVVAGARLIRHMVGARQCIIALEEDVPEAYESLQAAAGGDLELVKIPAVYPAGGEKQLIKILTGREVPAGGLPTELGILMQNVATAAAVFKAVAWGEPVVSRIVTVTGAVTNPCNVEVLIGTPIAVLVKRCGGFVSGSERLLIGGPMMGFELDDLQIPVTKTTNCLLALAEQQANRPEMPCIRCGACIDVCPARLQPQALYVLSRERDLDGAQDYGLFDCIECGCCSYACPSNIPLVQYYRYAKSSIETLRREATRAAEARSRFQARKRRLERESEERHVGGEGGGGDRSFDEQAGIKAEIAAAIERTRAKRKRMGAGSKPSMPDGGQPK